ncbi:MAG: hypothetical protein QXF09_01590 [Nitrososphaerota archaeon]
MLHNNSLLVTVYETINKMGGKILTSILLEELKRKGLDITLKDIYEILLKLEINGKIRVISLDKDKKMIEIVST